MLPKLIKAEVKFSTTRMVSVPHREIGALQSDDVNQVGILAVLFLCGERTVDGNWMIVDIKDLMNTGSSQTMNVNLKDLLRIQKMQPDLNELRDLLSGRWYHMVNGYRHEAMLGHIELKDELQYRFEEDSMAERLISDQILHVEHIKTMNQIANHHGASVSGHIFQDLFGYLFNLLGYHSITINPVGVPDVTITELKTGGDNIYIGPLTADDVQDIKECIRESGDLELLKRIEATIN